MINTNVHKWLEQVKHQDWSDDISGLVSSCIKFNFGVYKDYPSVKQNDIQLNDFIMPYDQCIFEYKWNFNEGPYSDTILLICTHGDIINVYVTVKYFKADKWLELFIFTIYKQDLSVEVVREFHKDQKDHEKSVGYNELTISLCCVIAAFNRALRCKNIYTLENKAPEALNKKRLSNGKLPIFTYKTIFIKNSGVVNKSYPMGTHASPRLHTRRRHIRRLSQDREVIVSECVVGTKKNGIVHKDYRI